MRVWRTGSIRNLASNGAWRVLRRSSVPRISSLAVATAIALFGFQSGAALATVVGVLIEVPVMLTVVRIVRSSRGWYERA